MLFRSRYSARIRSNGVGRQFGGARFAGEGRLLRELLEREAGLEPGSRVLEIGCGCGRTAYALAERLEPGHYTGMDVEREALEACRRSRSLAQRGFRFDWMDVLNREYNPTGSLSADSYRFPYPERSFDVVFLVSVFTHMLPRDVENYAGEIARMLRPGGRCLFTGFLLDHGTRGKQLAFRFRAGEARFEREDLPEIAVAYESRFFVELFRRHALAPAREPLIGTWRLGPPEPTVRFGQDVLVFARPASSG